MDNYINNALDEQFKSECKVLNLCYEYPGYKGDIKWAIISGLTEEEIKSKYPKQVKEYIPFTLLNSDYASARRRYVKNENKHYMRAVRNGHAFDYSDETEEHHIEIVSNSLEDEVLFKEEICRLREAILQLKPIQRKRLVKFFFYGKNLRQIAEEEGKAYSTVYESYESALKKLKKLLGTPDNLTSLCGNK